jgi:hypothetical protein
MSAFAIAITPASSPHLAAVSIGDLGRFLYAQHVPPIGPSYLDVPPKGLLYGRRDDGSSIDANAFAKRMREHLNAIGITGYTIHGLGHVADGAGGSRLVSRNHSRARARDASAGRASQEKSAAGTKSLARECHPTSTIGRKQN